MVGLAPFRLFKTCCYKPYTVRVTVTQEQLTNLPWRVFDFVRAGPILRGRRIGPLAISRFGVIPGRPYMPNVTSEVPYHMGETDVAPPTHSPCDRHPAVLSKFGETLQAGGLPVLPQASVRESAPRHGLRHWAGSRFLPADQLVNRPPRLAELVCGAIHMEPFPWTPMPWNAKARCQLSTSRRDGSLIIDSSE